MHDWKIKIYSNHGNFLIDDQRYLVVGSSVEYMLKSSESSE